MASDPNTKPKDLNKKSKPNSKPPAQKSDQRVEDAEYDNNGRPNNPFA